MLPNCKVFKNSTRYNESIETLAATLALSFVGIKEFALKYVCNSSDSDFRIALLTSSMSVFLVINTISMRCVLACIYKHRQILWMKSFESLFHYNSIVRQMLEMVGGKSFPYHPMWFQCFLFRWCKFPVHFCPWTCLTGELIAFRGCRKEKRNQRDWSNSV